MGSMARQYKGPETAGSLVPDEDVAIQAFENWFSEYTEGEIEIGWMGRATGALINFKRFPVGDFDEAASFAARTSAIAGQSVYFRPAVLKPGPPSEGKFTKDVDVLHLPGLWADLDTPEAVRGAKNVYATCQPNSAVITGTVPHKRAQVFWKAADPITGGDDAREVMRSIAGLLGGDTAVINPSSLMRVPGTLAWPWKEGRTAVELVGYRHYQDRPPATFARLKHNFPPRAAQPDPVAPTATADTRFDIDLGTTAETVEQMMQAIKAGREWHNNVVKIVAHWVGRGWSDAEILNASLPFTLPGYTMQDTVNEVRKAIEGARTKWAVPNPKHGLDDDPEVAIKRAINATPFDPTRLPPPRPWIIRNFAMEGRVTVLLAPGGVGKTTLTVDLATAYAAGEQEWCGYRIKVPGRVWIYNVEDDTDELQRRIMAVIKHRKVPAPTRLADKLFIDSGAARPVCVAHVDPQTRSLVRHPDVDALIDEIKARGIKLLIVDPFAETHQANENDNMQMRSAAAEFRRIAQKAGCAVVLVHHTSKIHGDDNIDSKAGDMDAGRGASSVSGVARMMFTLMNMSGQMADKLGIKPEDKHLYVRLDEAKSNVSLISDEIRWFRRVSVTIENDVGDGEFIDVAGEGADTVGVLTPWKPPSLWDDVSRHDVQAIMQIIDRGYEAGRLWGPTNKGGSERWVGNAILKVLPNKSDAHASRMVNEWRNHGTLVCETYRHKAKGRDEEGFTVDWSKVPDAPGYSTAGVQENDPPPNPHHPKNAFGDLGEIHPPKSPAP